MWLVVRVRLAPSAINWPVVAATGVSFCGVALMLKVWVGVNPPLPSDTV